MTSTHFTGLKIKALRLKNNKTLNEVSEGLGITKTYLSLIENGKKQPSKKIVSKASNFFSVPEVTLIERSKFLRDITENVSNIDISDLIVAFEMLAKED
ncbi:helix-turn-helix transcriptional regulator [uncultured Pantoea sp.]|uniref:helix-turn-helix domain-containing protein n=1 Tax=uncultured Pantoea sp. TaxID=218084 RepID=UPI0025FA0723|nr:helix-turn-helix transcriptional regulator [uncultured Pantoea sp.]